MGRYFFGKQLLPYSLRRVFLVFILVGVVFLYMYQKGIRPEVLTIKTFALLSTYIETKYFAIIQTNLTDEIGVFSLFIGSFGFVLTKEKNEQKHFMSLRLEAFLFALKLTAILWFLAYLFIYGYAIIALSLMAFFFFLGCYFWRFRYLIAKDL